MEIRLLGPIEVVKDGQLLDVGSRKQKTVLSVLAAHLGKPVSADECIQAAWGDDAPPGAVKSLHTYISNLRGLLDPERTGIIQGSDGTYRLNPPEGCRVDWEEFETLRDSEEPEDLMRALRLWRGRPFEDVEADWARPIATTWEEERFATVVRWADLELERGEAEEVVPTLESLVEEHPLREPLWERLMLALYQDGRQADALRSYQTLKERLADELGIDPSPRLQELEERILLQDPALARRASTPTNVPRPLSPTVGRDEELEKLDGLLDETRLLTITGAGGVGKTTMARDLAHRRRSDFAHGVWWLELAALRDPSLLIGEILGTMRLPPATEGDPLEILCAHLSRTRALLVFDNCEHLVEPVAAVVSAILQAAEGVKAMTTSREPLGVPGEVAWSLPPLSVPGTEATTPDEVLATDAGSLFQTRARQAIPDFAVTEENAARIAAICRRLDGLPFAIELAAARLRSMGLDELEARLDDRFSVLTGGSRTAMPHHRTLRDTVEWSYGLLEPAEQALYGALSVFRAGFELEAAQAVSEADDVLDLLDSLVTHSLLVVDRTNDQVRYRILETIREHGWEILEEKGRLDESRKAHLTWVGDMVREGARQLEGKEGPLWMSRFRKETDNIRAALEHAAETDPVTGAAICAGLSRFWFGYAAERDVTTLDDATSFLEEGRRWSERMLHSGAELPAKIRARLLTALGGLLLVRLGRFDESMTYLEEAKRLWAEIGDVRNQGWASFYLGVASWSKIPIAETIEHFERSFGLHEQAEDTFGTMTSRLLRAYALSAAGDHEKARPDLEAFSTAADRLGVPMLTAHASDALAMLGAMSGEPIEAQWPRIRSAIEGFRGIPNYACLCHAIHTVAMVLAGIGDLENSARCLGVVDSIRSRLGMVIAPYEDRTELVERLGLEALAAETRAEREAEGELMTPEEGISWVLKRIDAELPATS